LLRECQKEGWILVGYTHLPPQSRSPLQSSVKLVDQDVYLAVGGLDLALEGGLLVWGAGLLELLVKGEHLIHQRNHAIMLGFSNLCEGQDPASVYQ